MGRARKRRFRGVWFPNLGTAGPGADIDDDDVGLFIQFTLPTVAQGATFPSQTFVTPLTFDLIDEEQAVEGADYLSDLIGSEYVLRRIVGDCFVSRDITFNSGASAAAVLVRAGFFVARQADSTQGENLPIGANTDAELRENYSPSNVATIREPWIWRKTWILGNNGRTPAGGDPVIDGLNRHPATNTQYNGAMSNSRIDAKTLRRVGQDDRLWFAITARAVSTVWTGEGANPFTAEINTTGTVVKALLDYRLFGSLRKAKQQGRF